VYVYLDLLSVTFFCLNFKNIYQVHPSSFSIDGMLGNMRFCDMSLGPDHRWGWLCDIRKPGVESLIKVFLTVSFHIYWLMQ
jgi:hypothetical protein